MPNALKHGIEAVVCWKTNRQCRSMLAIASSIHYLNKPAVLSLCANLNLGNISLFLLSDLTPTVICHKVIPFSSSVYGVAYSLVLRSAVFKDLKHVINKQSQNSCTI